MSTERNKSTYTSDDVLGYTGLNSERQEDQWLEMGVSEEFAMGIIRHGYTEEEFDEFSVFWFNKNNLDQS